MTSSKQILSFTALFFLFLLLRFWGVQFGLPYDGIHPTEHFTVAHAIHYVETGSWKPFDFQHPTLLQYLITIIASIFRIPPAEYQYYYLIGRIISVLSSWGTLFLLYFFSRNLFDSRFWGLVSASVMGVSLVAVQYAHYAVPDSLSVFFLMGSIFLAQRALDRPSLSRYLGCGILCGCAIGSKFTGLLSVVFLCTAWMLAFSQKQRFRGLKLLGGLGVAFGVFTVLSPYHVRFGAEFIRDAAYYLAQKGYIGDFRLVSSGYWVYPFILIPGILGIIGFTCAVVGTGVLLKRYGRMGWLICIPYGLFYVCVGKEKGATLQNVLPLLPLFSCAISACLLWFMRRNISRCIVICTAIGIFLYPLVKSIAFDRLLLMKDTRVQAEEWMLRNLPAGSKIAGERYTPVDVTFMAVPLVKQHFDTYEFMDGLGEQPLEYYRQEGFNYLVTSGFRESQARFFCVMERKCETYDHYRTFDRGATVMAVFEPPFLARLCGLSMPWGSWPLQPRIRIVRVEH